MASSSDRGTKEILCRYFASNMCNKGADCPFSHDRTAKPDTVCRYYLAGNCVYGEQCRYDHKRPAVLPRGIGDTSSASSSKEVARKIGPKDALLSSNSKSSSGTKPPPHTAGSASNSPGPHLGASSSKESKFNPDANIFIPSWMKKPKSEEKTFADAAGSVAVLPLCPYFENGFCEKDSECQFVHGLVCDICGKACLHPADEEQCRRHREACEIERQAMLEMARAEERSADKVCGICMENVWERRNRFGILQRCKHCFCLDCIRKWRSNRNEMFEKEIVRSCPECRVHSDFVVPSKYWVEDSDEKELLIGQYREGNKKIQCKYIKGNDISGCPFGNKCFFKHELPDGTIAEGESPRLLRSSRTRRPNLNDFLFDDFDSDSDDDFDISGQFEAALEMIYAREIMRFA